MYNPIKEFKSIYPKEIQIYTLIFIFHMMRKTLLNQRHAMGDTTVSGGTLIMVMCVLLNFWIVYKNSKNIGMAIKGSKFFLWYTIVCLASFLWAIVPSIESIWLKDLEIISSFLAIAVTLWKIEDKDEALLYVAYLLTISAGLGVLNSLFKGGMHTNSYTLSAGMGTLVVLGLKRYITDVKVLNYMLIINVTALIVGTSSASYISFIVGFLIYASAWNNRLRLRNVLIIAIVAYVVFSFAEDILYEYVFYGHSKTAVEGGTGRYDMWQNFIEGWKKSPYLGYGYIVGERNYSLICHIPGMVILSAHNGYLSVLIGTGLLGMFFFAPYLIKTIYKNYIQCYDEVQGEYQVILLSALVMLLINNTSYPALGSDWNYTFPPIMGLLILIHQMEYKN